ncbi:MAG TPA: hypothetical protein PKN04_13525 [bacterium]|nr:hypothetical protein [bacterium]HNT66797.1 hypothetical protein [bacterium]HOX86817.1 hypothetical protein [bacterium]HPG46972.1 hypothetical protein [bacterium]HPM99260.1 hypothetical protein [bacterium]
MSKKSNLTMVRVDSVSLHKYHNRRKLAELRIYGYLPNPSYEIHHIETHLQGDEIVITPWASHDPSKIVIQMNVPFEHLCKIKGLEKNFSYQVRTGDEEGLLLQTLTVQ